MANKNIKITLGNSNLSQGALPSTGSMPYSGDNSYSYNPVSEKGQNHTYGDNPNSYNGPYGQLINNESKKPYFRKMNAYSSPNPANDGKYYKSNKAEGYGNPWQNLLNR